MSSESAPADLAALGAVPLEEARERWLSELEFLGASRLMGSEEIPVVEARGRVTSHPVTARISSPHYYSAAIDGLALRSTATFAATPESPVVLVLGRDCAFVDTGSALPEGCDAVVPVREVRLASAEEVQIDRPSTPWRNVRPAGEDVAAREVIVPRDHRLGPVDVGALLAGGANTVRVYRRPRVAIVPLGNNLVEPGETPGVGQMIDTTSPILVGLAEETGAEVRRLPVMPERLDQVRAVVAELCRIFNMVILVGGPSHGTALAARLLADDGELVVYGVAIKPGHSVAMGVLEETAVLALPFFPVSAFLGFDLFARPVLAHMVGQRPPEPLVEEAVLAVPIRSNAGIDEFLRVRLGLVGERRVAVPVSRGAAMLMSLLRADGLLRVPAAVEAIDRGARVPVARLEPLRPIEGNILLLGTHDICYDLIRTHLLYSHPDLRLFSANTGSAEGLEAVRQGLCHLAALHLFDAETGEYNIPHVQREMADIPCVLVNLFRRYLGLLVAPGNPKKLTGLADLTREDVTFINRQVGSGTRVLLDYHLARAGIDPARIQGYAREAYTHMSVAAAVSSGAADAGLSIPAAAKALRLDFVPCIPERLDLLIPKRFYNLYPLQSLLSVIRSAAFRAEASSSLQGYDFSESGKVIWESP